MALVEVRGSNNSLAHPRGAVDVVTITPTVAREKFLVRFPDGFESAFDRTQLEVLKLFKDRLSSVGRDSVEPGTQNPSDCQQAAGTTFDLESCITRTALNDLLIRIRLHTLKPRE